MSSNTLSSDQVYRVVENRHSNPFEVLGSHTIDQAKDKTHWVIRAYLPDADAAWVVRPEPGKSTPWHRYIIPISLSANYLARRTKITCSR
jgi:hypothetical protein